MRRAAVLLLVALLAGCGGSSDEAEPPTSASTEAGAQSDNETPPRSYEEVMERLPPFDVPASSDVEAYRKATIDAFFDRCINVDYDAVKARFVKANRAILDSLPVFPGAKLDYESSSDDRSFNGCLEGTGPATSYTTYRRFDLPAATRGEDVLEFYEQELSNWKGGVTTPCESSYSRGEASIYLTSCAQEKAHWFEIKVRALETHRPPEPRKPPPRPYGAQYPFADDARGTPEATGHEVEPGETCERVSGVDVPSLIIPPSPGISAELKNEPLHGFERHVLVEWSFHEIHGDCPPTSVHLTLVNPDPSMPPLSVPFDVREREGTAQLPLLDHMRDVRTLLASAQSLDGTRSRTVAVLIRR
jgi:hypothetical protein